MFFVDNTSARSSEGWKMNAQTTPLNKPLCLCFSDFFLLCFTFRHSLNDIHVCCQGATSSFAKCNGTLPALSRCHGSARRRRHFSTTRAWPAAVATKSSRPRDASQRKSETRPRTSTKSRCTQQKRREKAAASAPWCHGVSYVEAMDEKQTKA